MTAALTNAQLVAETARAIYGADWQAPLSRALGVQLRTVQRVAAAAGEGRDYPAARPWLADLERLADEHGQQLGKLERELRRRV